MRTYSVARALQCILTILFAHCNVNLQCSVCTDSGVCTYRCVHESGADSGSITDRADGKRGKRSAHVLSNFTSLMFFLSVLRLDLESTQNELHTLSSTSEISLITPEVN